MKSRIGKKILDDCRQQRTPKWVSARHPIRPFTRVSPADTLAYLAARGSIRGQSSLKVSRKVVERLETVEPRGWRLEIQSYYLLAAGGLPASLPGAVFIPQCRLPIKTGLDLTYNRFSLNTELGEGGEQLYVVYLHVGQKPMNCVYINS